MVEVGSEAMNYLRLLGWRIGMRSSRETAVPAHRAGAKRGNLRNARSIVLKCKERARFQELHVMSEGEGRQLLW